MPLADLRYLSPDTRERHPAGQAEWPSLGPLSPFTCSWPPNQSGDCLRRAELPGSPSLAPVVWAQNVHTFRGMNENKVQGKPRREHAAHSPCLGPKGALLSRYQGGTVLCRLVCRSIIAVGVPAGIWGVCAPARSYCPRPLGLPSGDAANAAPMCHAAAPLLRCRDSSPSLSGAPRSRAWQRPPAKSLRRPL